MGLPPALAARLAERSLGTARDLFSRTLLDLVELLDLPYETVRFILREVAARITPQPQTVRRGGGRAGLPARSAEGRAGAELRANSGGMRECGELALLICPTSHPPADLHQLEQVLHLMRAAAAQPLHLRTGLAPLDEALFGGLPAGSVTEARAALQGAGPAGWPGCRLGLAARHAARLARPATASPTSCRIPPTCRPTCRPHPARSSRPAPAQVVGPAGLGKTQLCLQAAVLGYLERLRDGASVAYVDTEKKFSGQRCARPAAACWLPPAGCCAAPGFVSCWLRGRSGRSARRRSAAGSGAPGRLAWPLPGLCGMAAVEGGSEKKVGGRRCVLHAAAPGGGRRAPAAAAPPCCRQGDHAGAQPSIHPACSLRRPPALLGAARRRRRPT